MSVMMKHINWYERFEIVCAHHKMCGVHINYDDFNIMDNANNQWAVFVDQVQQTFEHIAALNIMSSVINDDLILFENEKEARVLTDLLNMPVFNDITATFIPIP